MENTKSIGRICLFDNIKFFLILTVVVGHFADFGTSESAVYRSIFIFIYSFHMPLFIFITGLFNKNKDVATKVISFIFLGFATKIGLAVSNLLINGSTGFSLLSDGGLPWFMFVTGGFYLISYLLRNVDKRLVLIMSVLLACFVGYDASAKDYLYLSRTVVFYPFFVMGEMVSKESLIKINKNKVLKAVSVCVLVLFGFLCFTKLENLYVLRPLFTGRNSFSSNSLFEVWGPVYRLLCYGITVVASVCIICLVPSGNIPAISKFGSRTIQVYYWHWPVAVLLSKFGVFSALFTTPTGKLIWLFLGVIVTVILSMKPFGFPTVQILNMTRKKN